MALWEYKTITSGRGGFASATMLESFLNQLGKDEWEIIDFRADPTNALVFTGLARRPTQREWTLEAAIAAAAKAETDKLRAELMLKQHAGDATASSDAAGDKPAATEELRQLRDTDRDSDPEALADEASHGSEDWNNLENFEEDLPNFFDAIKPHLRKNPNTPGQSVALNYLAKRWEQPETDLHGALRECGFTIPESDADAPVYLEFEGDLYWVEKNNRAQFFLNTREKPRPKFRIVQGKPLDPADPAYLALTEEQAAAEAERAKRLAEQAAREAEALARRAEREAQRLAAEQARREQQAAAQAAREAARAAAVLAPEAAAPAEVAAPLVEGAALAPEAGVAGAAGGVLPAGDALLDAIRPQMRRNRRGPGYSGSSAYLAKHFKVEEETLRSALATLGLAPTENPAAKAEVRVIGAYAYWANKDNNGGLWINGREATPRERADASGGGVPTPVPVEAVASESVPAEPAAQPERAAGTQHDQAGGPPIFRAVPRAMPPIPPASEPAVESTSKPVAAAVSSPAPDGQASRLAALRLLMKPNKSRSGVSGSVAFLAGALGCSEAELLAGLTGHGLLEPVAVSEGEAEAKPVFVEHGDEIFWLSRYAKDGSIWLNAKAARSAARKPKAKNDGAAEKPAAGGEAGKPAKSSRPRARRKE